VDKMDKAKHDYIAGLGSYRALAAKYGISLKTLSMTAKAEGWVELRRQTRLKAATKVMDAVSDRDAAVQISIYDVADRLLGKIDSMAGKELTAKMIRELTAALKDIKDIKHLRSELDIQEQQARIDKLRKEAERSEQDSGTELVVTIEDGGMDYGG